MTQHSIKLLNFNFNSRNIHNSISILLVITQHYNMMVRSGLHRDLQRGKTTSFNFHDFIDKRDYIGALAVLDLDSGAIKNEVEHKLWRAYCLFQLGHFERAKEIYSDLLSGETNDVPIDTGLYLACIYFILGLYRESEEMALKAGGDPELKNRILLHVACKNDDETKVAKYRQDLTTSTEDRLSAAAVEFSFRRRYQETDNICKSILAEEKDSLALYVYIAMCLFKMVNIKIKNYFDIIQLCPQQKNNRPIILVSSCNCRDITMFRWKIYLFTARQEINDMKYVTIIYSVTCSSSQNVVAVQLHDSFSCSRHTQTV